MNNKLLLGKRLRELRRRNGLKQEQLAEIISVESASISNIENGRNYPSLQTLENIIVALNTSFSEVFDYEHKKESKDLLAEIVKILEQHPDKIEDAYKIINALTK